MTIDYLPWNGLATLADRVCMRDTNVELTYADVARRVDAAAGLFAAAGVGPTAIHIVPELPRNAVGKIDKPALRKSTLSAPR